MDNNIYNLLQETQKLRVSDGEVVPILNNCSDTNRLLLIIWSQLGDFDSLEYAWWLRRESAYLQEQGITVRAIGIGDRPSGLKFSQYTGFPASWLFVDPNAKIHQQLDLYQGLSWKFPLLNQSQTAWVNLMLMCAGIGSPGTLKEVLRGYTGDQKSPQLIDAEESIHAKPLPPLKGSFFNIVGGSGFQRPLELATLRLRNMTEVLSNWSTYVPNSAYLTQRGATFLFDQNRQLIYQHREKNILGFAENMTNPLGFLGVQ